MEKTDTLDEDNSFSRKLFSEFLLGVTSNFKADCFLSVLNLLFLLSTLNLQVQEGRSFTKNKFSF